MEGQCYYQALIRVQRGETITHLVKHLFVTRRRYNEKLTKSERAQIARARAEYVQAHKQDRERNTYPRLFIETTAERRLAVLLHCKEQGISVARFCNAAIAEALRLTKEKDVKPA